MYVSCKSVSDGERYAIVRVVSFVLGAGELSPR